MFKITKKIFLDPFKGLLFFQSYLIFHKKFFGLTSRPQEVKKIKAPCSVPEFKILTTM